MLPRLAFALVVLAGCGPSGTISGTVDGKTFPVADVGTIATIDGGDRITSLLVTLSSSAGVCDDLANGTERAGASRLRIRLAKADGGELETGEYTVVSDGASTMQRAAHPVFFAGDAACRDTLDASKSEVTGGTVIVSAIEHTNKNGQRHGAVRGRFTLTVGSDATPVTGTFDSSICESTLLIEQPACE